MEIQTLVIVSTGTIGNIRFRRHPRRPRKVGPSISVEVPFLRDLIEGTLSTALKQLQLLSEFLVKVPDCRSNPPVAEVRPVQTYRSYLTVGIGVLQTAGDRITWRHPRLDDTSFQDPINVIANAFHLMACWKLKFVTGSVEVKLSDGSRKSGPVHKQWKLQGEGILTKTADLKQHTNS